MCIYIFIIYCERPDVFIILAKTRLLNKGTMFLLFIIIKLFTLSRSTFLNFQKYLKMNSLFVQLVGNKSTFVFYLHH